MGTSFHKGANDLIYKPERVMKESRTFPITAESHRFPSTPSDMYDHLSVYNTSVWVYASVFAIATSAAGVELKFYETGEDKKEIEDTQIGEVIASPNELMTEDDLWEATFTFLELTGNCYWEKVREKKTNKLKELYVLRPDFMKIQGDPKTLVGKYIYSVNGADIEFEPSEIVHFKYFNPLSEMYGFSPMKPADQTVLIDLYASAYNKNFFKMGARIGGTLETDRHLSNDAITRLEDSWNLEYGINSGAAWKTAVLQEGLKYKEVSSSHTDMDFIKGRVLSREEIIAVMGLYPIILGITEGSNYANAHQQKRLFYQHTIIPKLKKVQSRITKEVKIENAKAKAKYDTEGIEALREEKEIQAKIDAQYVDSGVMTINEVRKERGLGPVSWGDKWWPRKGTRTPVGAVGTHVEKPPGTDESPFRVYNRNKKRNK